MATTTYSVILVSDNTIYSVTQKLQKYSFLKIILTLLDFGLKQEVLEAEGDGGDEGDKLEIDN